MSKELVSVPFTTDDGDTVRFYVLEQTMIGGIRYLLVEEADDPEETVYIMKEEAGTGTAGQDKDGDENISCIFVEDEEELVSVMKIFEQLMDDTDIVTDF